MGRSKICSGVCGFTTAAEDKDDEGSAKE